MARRYHRILLLFVDGVGLAPAGPGNPFARCAAPFLERVLGGRLCLDGRRLSEGTLLTGLDATLGLPGLPQSATGQTALFTGVNGAERLGRHATGFPGPSLRSLIAEASIFRRAHRRGLEVTFANAYSDRYLEALERRAVKASVTTCAVSAAGLRFRRVEDLLAGRAATWDIERDLFGRRPGHRAAWVDGLERVEAATAGRHLARLAARHDLTVFETFLPDLVGHGRIDLSASEVVRRIDDLLAGAVAERSPDTTVVMTSDHGNFEDSTVRTHTRAPVPLLAMGPAASELADLDSLLGITPRLLRLLDRR